MPQTSVLVYIERRHEKAVSGHIGPQGPVGPPGGTYTDRGVWASGVAYAVDDLVTHLESGVSYSYRATSAHTSASVTEPDVGVDWQTVWAETDGSLAYRSRLQAEAAEDNMAGLLPEDGVAFADATYAGADNPYTGDAVAARDHVLAGRTAATDERVLVMVGRDAAGVPMNVDLTRHGGYYSHPEDRYVDVYSRHGAAQMVALLLTSTIDMQGAAFDLDMNRTAIDLNLQA